MSEEITLVDSKGARDARTREAMRSVRSTYITSRRDMDLEHEIDVLIEQAEEMVRMKTADPEKAAGRLCEGRALIVVGESGAGKTRSLERLFAREEAFAPEDGASPLIRVTAPSPCTLRLLGQRLVCELGYPSDREPKENVVWDMARRFLALQAMRYVHIDELQHLSQTRNPIEITKVRNTLKGLMQSSEWPVCLILSGLPEIEGLIKGDSQLFRRSHFVRLPSLSFHEDARDIKAIVRLLGKRKAGLSVGHVTTDEFASRLLHAAMRQMGILIEYVQDAVCAALMEDSDELQSKHFAKVYQARTGCYPNENVFTCAGDWTLLDVAAVQVPDRGGAQHTAIDSERPMGATRRRR